MNKLMGFLELKEMRLPVIPWKQYTGREELDDGYLWTIRSAIYRGNDLNLPRLVGENAEKAKKFADQLFLKMKEKGIVIYYPYFIAKKSGTLEVKQSQVIIEAVREDLWNMVTYSEREVTIIKDELLNTTESMGNDSFLTQEEQNGLYKYVSEIRKIFRDDLLEGHSALLEWSYAQSCNKDREPVGEEYLVFYEARTI